MHLGAAISGFCNPPLQPMAKDRGENCCLRIDVERAEKAMSERSLYDLPEKR